ncbi:radial spoke head 1 homolog [Octopus sinensis]|uniref:Radial spoke head 1 homolog n=1 Tax=Octopus sinensis TaxID=2607531 RepID=A0A6P7SGD8_9MOLL|nr:radial spoke head 1 homolog [Octopus sinensis]
MSLPASDEGEEEQGTYLGEYEGERNEREERHGMGKAILPNLDSYTGMYEDGRRHGTGVYRFKNEARYTGEYQYNKKHGQGTFIYPDGSKYEGQWVKDQRCGSGTYYYVNGDVYTGEWEEHVRHGQGSYIYAGTKSQYIGCWANGRMNGFGELIHANHKYVGTFKDDKPDGIGKYVFDIGCEQQGTYVQVRKDQDLSLFEEEEIAQVTIPVWIAGATTGLHLKPSQEELPVEHIEEEEEAKEPEVLEEEGEEKEAEPEKTEESSDNTDPEAETILLGQGDVPQASLEDNDAEDEDEVDIPQED